MKNFNAERLKLADATTQLKTQINALKDDLARYRARPDASEKYAFFKEQQIKTLEAVAESFTEYADSTDAIYSEQLKEIAALKNKVFSLEGISLLHGISNLHVYMQMKKESLIRMVKSAFQDNWRQTPFDLLDNTTRKHDPEYRRITTTAQKLIYNGKEKTKR